MDSRQLGAGNAAVAFWINQQKQRVEAAAHQNIGRALQARTLAKVVRLKSIPIPAEIRFARASIPGLRRLEHVLTDRLDTILKATLAEMEKAGSSEDAKTLRGKLLRDCECLRGNFPMQYRRAESESARLVYLKQKSEKADVPGSSQE